MASRLTSVLCIYNTDYDDELKLETGADVSAVEEAARAVQGGIAEFGYSVDLVGVQGTDLDLLIARLREQRPQLVFNLCESMNGDVRNEVVLPSVLDMLQIPYTGPGPLTILLCLHKDRTKEVLRREGIPTPEHMVFNPGASPNESDLDALDYPYFLKLAHEDASVGIDDTNVVGNKRSLLARVEELHAKYRQPVIAERYIEGREVNVTVMESEHGLEILPLHEIDFAAMPGNRPNIVSYAAKWDESHVDYEGTKPVPMKDVTAELERALAEVSKASFRALGMRDFGRVDIRIDADGCPWVIDLNPNCDLSPDAGVARAAAFGGISYPRLVGRVCQSAWRRSGGDL